MTEREMLFWLQSWTVGFLLLALAIAATIAVWWHGQRERRKLTQEIDKMGAALAHQRDQHRAVVMHNQWIVSKLERQVAMLTKRLEAYQIDAGMATVPRHWQDAGQIASEETSYQRRGITIRRLVGAGRYAFSKNGTLHLDALTQQERDQEAACALGADEQNKDPEAAPATDLYTLIASRTGVSRAHAKALWPLLYQNSPVTLAKLRQAIEAETHPPAAVDLLTSFEGICHADPVAGAYGLGPGPSAVVGQTFRIRKPTRYTE